MMIAVFLIGLFIGNLTGERRGFKMYRDVQEQLIEKKREVVEQPEDMSRQKDVILDTLITHGVQSTSQLPDEVKRFYSLDEDITLDDYGIREVRNAR